MGLILGSGSGTKPQFPYDMWYGVQHDNTSKDYKLKRVGNLELHKTLPLQNRMKRFVENEDGTVKYYLHPNDSRLTEGGAKAILDGSDGNVMLELPEHYFRLEINGTSWIYAISEYPLPGFTKVERQTISPWFATYDNVNKKPVSASFLTWDGDNVKRDSNGLPVFTANAANCRGGSNNASWDGTYRSLIGMGRTSVNKSTVRGWCNAVGNGIHHGAGRAYNTIKWFQRIEYASMYNQDAYTAQLTDEGYHQGGLGSGCSCDGNQWNTHNGYNPFIPCGVTLPLGNNTGKVSYTVKNWAGGGTDKVFQVTSYRGFGVPFEYLWMLADDFLVYYGESESTLYVCKDPSKFTSHSDSATTVPEGYEAAVSLPRDEGWGLVEGITSYGLSAVSKVGGSPTTGNTDYFWRNATVGWWGALLGALACDGADAGFGFLDATYRSSLSCAYLGFRLCRN